MHDFFLHKRTHFDKNCSLDICKRPSNACAFHPIHIGLKSNGRKITSASNIYSEISIGIIIVIYLKFEFVRKFNVPIIELN